MLSDFKINISDKVKGTLYFDIDNNPFKKGLGNYKDINGEVWYISVITQNFICAIKKHKLHPCYSETIDLEYHSWEEQIGSPYNIEFVNL